MMIPIKYNIDHAGILVHIVVKNNDVYGDQSFGVVISEYGKFFTIRLDRISIPNMDIKAFLLSQKRNELF